MSHRPLAIRIYAVLLLLSSLFMALLGYSASAYYYSAAALLVVALLLWLARGYIVVTWLLLLCQLSGIALILVLWLGDGLGDIKLDISGVMLLINVFCGGPLMAILALPMLPLLRRDKPLYRWFHSHRTATI